MWSPERTAEIRRGLHATMLQQAEDRAHPGRLLSRLLPALGEADFLQHVWDKAPHVDETSLDRLPEVASLPALSDVRTLCEAVAETAAPNVAVVGRGLEVQMRADQAWRWFRGGACTVVARNLHRVMPELASWCHRLAGELEVPRGSIYTHAFCSPAVREGTPGLDLHFDAAHLFALQVRGSKTWIFEPAADLPHPLTDYCPGFAPEDAMPDRMKVASSGRIPRKPAGNATSVTLHPGSVLYLPPGTWHTTTAGAESLSLSTFVQLPSRLDLFMAWLFAELGQDPRWRRSVSSSSSSASSMLEMATHTLGTSDRDALEEIVRTAHDNWDAARSGRSLYSVGPFYRPNPGITWSLDPDRPGGRTLRIDSRTYPVEAPAVPLLKWCLLRSKTFSIQQAQANSGGLDGEDVFQLMALLLQVGGVLPGSRPAASSAPSSNLSFSRTEPCAE